MKIIDCIAPVMPAPDELHDEMLRPDLEDRTFSIPIGRARRIGIIRSPGWWVVPAAPLTIIVALIVLGFCFVTTRGPQ